ncbi:hypothetical protein [Puniceibacterium sp. IMCC21224]|uniref:hypothetical protein n=1 Tax=Puniceibacterium sp. IMCC21224 TaxID=1618204 RepID=UPI00064DC32F|nr:hypothetical protein [Puniceibacterium sp. IMCC21224]KMK69025.1 hypothetical protein IMCC21224_113913 [Puniceibacterium sp. IMCC21224]
MGKKKQKKQAAAAYDPEQDNREPKEDSLVRDEKNGWNHEESTLNGRSQAHALFKVNAPYPEDATNFWYTPLKKLPKNAELVYTKDAEGNFTFSPRPKNDVNQRRGTRTLPHSMLGKAQPVIGAGECETDDQGKIARADNFSGHYQPGEKNLKETKDNFEEKGMASDGTKYEVFDKSAKVIKTL